MSSSTGLFPNQVLVTACRCAGAASAATVVTLLLFYSVDLRTGSQHGFGPLSDIGTVAWNGLLLPVLVGFRPVLAQGRLTNLLVLATALTAVVSALASAGLVAEVLAFEVATPLSVLAVLTQSAWLYVLSRRLQGTSWPLGLVRLGTWGPVAQGFGAAAFAVSLLFGWETTPQLAIMAIGIAPGLLSWLSWPVWFLAAAAALTRSGVPMPEPQPFRAAMAEAAPTTGVW